MKERSRDQRERVLLHALLVGGALFALVLTAVGSAAAAPRVVVTTPHPIAELGVGRNHFVWRSTWERSTWAGVRVEAALVVERRATRTRERVARVSSNPSFGWYLDLALLGFARGRLLWQELLYDRFGVEESALYTRTLADRRVRRVRYTYDDDWILEADRAPILVGDLWGRILNPGECLDDDGLPTPTCRWVADGEAFRLEAARYRALPAVPPPYALSASGVRLALVRADPQETIGSWQPLPLSSVELRRLDDGALVRTIPVVGTPRAITLAPRALAVLVEEGGALRIDRLRHDGTLLGSTPVPARTAWRLESDRNWIVASSRGRILAVSTATGELTTLATLRTPPLELQARAGRVYWAANGRGHGRVLSLPLPAG